MRSKKFTSLFLAILLLVSNLGLAINVHYCGDKIASVSSVFSTVTSAKSQSPKKDCCCKVDNKDKDSCCKNKIVDLKKGNKDVIVKTFSFQVQTALILVKSIELHFATAEIINSCSNESEYYCSPNAPPLFKLYHKYIFYA